MHVTCAIDGAKCVGCCAGARNQLPGSAISCTLVGVGLKCGKVDLLGTEKGVQRINSVITSKSYIIGKVFVRNVENNAILMVQVNGRQSAVELRTVNQVVRGLTVVIVCRNGSCAV